MTPPINRDIIIQKDDRTRYVGRYASLRMILTPEEQAWKPGQMDDLRWFYLTEGTQPRFLPCKPVAWAPLEVSPGMDWTALKDKTPEKEHTK